MVVVRIKNLKKSFNGEKVLDDVSFEIVEGEKVVLFGHNGSGKTTLLRCIMGFESFEGEIQVLGFSVNSPHFQSIKNYLGYVPQVHPLWSAHVQDVINLVCSSRRAPFSEVEKMLDIFELNLSSIYRKKMNELSGGMRQKLLLIFAFLGNPEILLLDEPFSHLDTSAQEKLFDFLQNLKSTLLISTHRIQDVSFATRVIYMKNGRVENDEKKK
jgi:ABC-type multidrug transport system ATPase subunit